MGAPKIEVIAFIGKVKSIPGICEMVSQHNINKAPINMVAQNNMPWLLVWNTNFAKCGTANPTKAIGPANAVMLPARRLVAKMIR